MINYPRLIATAAILSFGGLASAESMSSEKSFDVDGDGFIDKEEAGQSVEDFDAFDKNGDGKLSIEQFAKAIADRKNDGADTPADSTIKRPGDGEPADKAPNPQPGDKV